MLLLLLSILSSTSIFLLFKLISRYRIPVWPTIVINYFTASLLAFGTQDFSTINISAILTFPFIVTTIIIGVLFIVMFFVIAKSSELTGISKTTTVSKMSVILPILFSIVAYDEHLSLWNYCGIFLALVAVFLTIYKKESSSSAKYANLWILILLFLGMGGVDISIKYAQARYISNEVNSLFSGLLFFTSFISGLIFAFPQKSFRQSVFSAKVWLYGSLLGIVNFGTVYFLIATLNSHVFASSIIFGINNTAIVLLSFLLGLLFFKEPLSKINIVGIITSLIAIGLLTLS